MIVFGIYKYPFILCVPLALKTNKQKLLIGFLLIYAFSYISSCKRKKNNFQNEGNKLKLLLVHHLLKFLFML